MSIEAKDVIKIKAKERSYRVPDDVKYIGDCAFFYNSLCRINLSISDIISIGKYAFANQHYILGITVPCCLREIGEGAFNNCSRLSDFRIDKNSELKVIGARAFHSCRLLEKFEFPRRLESIGDEAFYCNIKEYDLVDTRLKFIGRDAFKLNIGGKYPNVFLPPTVDVASVSNNFDCNINIGKHLVIRKDGCGYYVGNNTIFRSFRSSKHFLIRRSVEAINNCFIESLIVSITIPSSVVEIGRSAFDMCKHLKRVRFTKDSRLKEIKEEAFFFCDSLRKMKFPKSLMILRKRAFSETNLEEVTFPSDSKLEIVENAFYEGDLQKLVLPPSVREIRNVHKIYTLKSISINNDIYESNEEGSAIFTKDRSELVCVVNSPHQFEIPEGVRVIRKMAFFCSNSKKIVIPSSVEIIESKAFEHSDFSIIEFAEGSKLKSLGFNAFNAIDELVINNENFVTMENGVIMSINPRGIVFVPRELTELEIDPDVEVIYSSAFYGSQIRSLNFPKSLKKICYNAFGDSNLESVTFEDGTELDFIEKRAFNNTKIRVLKLPLIKNKIKKSIGNISKYILPPNFSAEICSVEDSPCFVCPVSSLPSIAKLNFKKRNQHILNSYLQIIEG